mmetsp:Transcript_22821/g.33791  ORF Transcript_22821/g.33791 Transcript_22821/m.33791 type:complete len:94 (-) Transcript_22821:198-479(-)
MNHYQYSIMNRAPDDLNISLPVRMFFEMDTSVLKNYISDANSVNEMFPNLSHFTYIVLNQFLFRHAALPWSSPPTVGNHGLVLMTQERNLKML